MDDLRLSLQEIRQLCEHMLSAIADDVGEHVALHVDYYWNIPREELYDVYVEPSELTVGQIQEDLDSLRKTLAEGEAWSPRKRYVGSARCWWRSATN